MHAPMAVYALAQSAEEAGIDVLNRVCSVKNDVEVHGYECDANLSLRDGIEKMLKRRAADCSASCHGAPAPGTQAGDYGPTCPPAQSSNRQNLSRSAVALK